MMLEIRHFASVIVLTGFAAALPLASSAQSVTQYSYDAQGRLTGTQQGEGVTSDYTMDPASNRTRVRVTPQFPQAWSTTNSAIGHMIGRAEGSAWSGVSVGSHVAAFRLMVDNNTANNANVVVLDVWDATSAGPIVSRQLTRSEWKAAFAYQVFELPFTLDASRAGHAIEFRVLYQQTSYVRVERVGYR
jgi:YD repeat-containing protein